MLFPIPWIHHFTLLCAFRGLRMIINGAGSFVGGGVPINYGDPLSFDRDH
jgi:hypothetical protein